MEIQQSPQYKKYIASVGWNIITVDGVQIFIKHIPLIGTLAKIQRPEVLPFLPKLIPILQKNHVTIVAPEPLSSQNQEEFSKWIKGLSKFFKIYKNPFLPTKTICVDLTPTEEMIFNKFSEAKRRAVRRAIKLGVSVKESRNIKDLIYIKGKSAGLFGSITTTWADTMWRCFSSNNATILLAYHNNVLLGGIFLIFYDSVAYYWIAGATKKGKKLFAPTLLVWEALKLEKQRGATQFDFIGVFDERIPKENTSWKGFTKFKEGFGGTTVYYPLSTSMPHK